MPFHNLDNMFPDLSFCLIVTVSSVRSMYLCMYEKEDINVDNTCWVSVCACSVASVMSDSVIPKTVACQAPLSLGFSRRGYCSGLPLPPPGDLLHRDWICISRASFTAGRLFTTEPSGSLLSTCVCVLVRSVVSDSATYGLVAHQAPLSRLWKGIHGILQARILEWVAISFSRGSSQPRHWTWVSCTAGGFFTI